jgi:hypothetical protein
VLTTFLLSSRDAKRNSHSAGQHVVEQMEYFMDISSSDYDSDLENDHEINDKQADMYKTQKIIQPTTSYRYVHRFNGQHSLSKMKNDESHRIYFLTNYADVSNLPDTSEDLINDSDDNDDDNDIVMEVQSPIEQEHNLDDIRQKTLEYDRQQLKGIQLANAGSNNLKIINNYPMTSNTCILL